MIRVIFICSILILSACKDQTATKPKDTNQEPAIKIDSGALGALNYTKPITSEEQPEAKEINFIVEEGSLEHTFYTQELSIKAAALRDQRKSTYIGLYSKPTNQNNVK